MRRQLAVLLMLLVLANFSWGQAGVLTQKAIWDLCPPLAYVATKDSSLLESSVDSIARLMAGRWELLEVSGGWGPNHPPARATEMVLNQLSQGEIYENGVWSAHFELTMTRRWRTIRFKINEPGKPFFNFGFSQKSLGGTVRVCDQKLIISDAMGDGIAYAFRRIPMNQPARRYTYYNATALLDYKPWFGTANATMVREAPDKPCTANRFSLNVVTDLPYDQAATVKNQVTGCTVKCVPTQLLSIDNIPLAVGWYETKDLDTCCATTSSGTRYDRLLGGDAIVDTYLSKYSNRVRITAFDPVTNIVEGTFELSLFTPENKHVYFKDGKFKATVGKY